MQRHATPRRALGFVQLQAGGQLMSPADCARQLLARLDRADFGNEPIADIRD